MLIDCNENNDCIEFNEIIINFFELCLFIHEFKIP